MYLGYRGGRVTRRGVVCPCGAVTELETHKGEIEQQIATGQARLHELTGKRPDAAAVAKLLADFADLWKYMTETQRERAIALVVEKVEMLTKTDGEPALDSAGSPLAGWLFSQS
jgi:hypothetical protein